MNRFLNLLSALVVAVTVSPALAEITQGTPQFYQDTTGSCRVLSVRDPSTGSNGADSRTSLGWIETTTHTATPTGDLLAVSQAANCHPRIAPQRIHTYGYWISVPGVGAADYEKVASEPTHSFKFSITLAGGTTVWYGLAKSEWSRATPDMVGALGDSNATTGNGADDTAELTASQSLGVPIHLRAGAIYRLSSNVVVASNAGFIGPPDRNATLYMDPAGIDNTGNVSGSSTGQRYGSTSQALLVRGATGSPFAPITNVVLRDFIIDGGGTGTPTRCCQMIWLNNAVGVRISGIEMKNWTTYGIRASTIRNVKITDNDIHDFTNDAGLEYSGIQLDDDKFGVNGCAVEENATHTGDETVAGESCDVEINGNRISNMLVSETGYLNTFTDVALPDGYQPNGIKLNAGNRIIVTNNHIDHTGQNIDAYTINSIFSNNDVSYGLGFCIALKHRNMSNVIIGNHASYCGAGGIAIGGDSITTSNGNRIVGNSIRYVGEDEWTGFTDTLWDTADSYCIGWITTTGNLVSGNSCTPGLSGAWAWSARSGNTSTNFWSDNNASPGTSGIWYPTVVEDGRLASANVDAYVPWRDVASASGVDLKLAGSNLLNITGVVTIADFINGNQGQHFVIKFAGGLILRCTGGMLVCPGGANILTVAGDKMEFVVETPFPTTGGAGAYRMLWYVRATGKALVASACADITDKTTVGCAVFTASTAAAQRTALGAEATDVQVFTSSGTWTKPSGTIKRVHAMCIGAGGGGGGGARVASGTAASGGGGGGAGSLNEGWYDPAAITSPVTVTINAAGTGGAGSGSDGVAGSDGVIGGSALFGTYLSGFPGGRGGGGQIAAVSGGGGGAGILGTGTNATGSTPGDASTFSGRIAGGTSLGGPNPSGGGGGAGSSAVGVGFQAGSGFQGGGGGGSGGGLATSPVSLVGGAGGTALGVYTAATAGPIATNGNLGASAALGVGGGGSGAGSNASGAGFIGGAGGSYGGGGGGGSVGLGANGGTGGAGGGGLCVVESYY